MGSGGLGSLTLNDMDLSNQLCQDLPNETQQYTAEANYFDGMVGSLKYALLSVSAFNKQQISGRGIKKNCCRIVGFSERKKTRHRYPKRGRGVKGRLEFFQKFIQIWESGRPLNECMNWEHLR